MGNTKLIKNPRSQVINTTIGEFVEAVYDAALEEYMDEIMARRIAMQMLIRKLRCQGRHSIAGQKQKIQAQEKISQQRKGQSSKK